MSGGGSGHRRVETSRPKRKVRVIHHATRQPLPGATVLFLDRAREFVEVDAMWPDPETYLRATGIELTANAAGEVFFPTSRARPGCRTDR